MRAVLSNQAEPALGVTEQNQILAQHAHGLRDIVKIAQGTYHNPIAAKPFARRRAGTDMGNISQGYFSVQVFCPLLHGSFSDLSLSFKDSRSKFKVLRDTVSTTLNLGTAV